MSRSPITPAARSVAYWKGVKPTLLIWLLAVIALLIACAGEDRHPCNDKTTLEAAMDPIVGDEPHAGDCDAAASPSPSPSPEP